MYVTLLISSVFAWIYTVSHSPPPLFTLALTLKKWCRGTKLHIVYTVLPLCYVEWVITEYIYILI